MCGGTVWIPDEGQKPTLTRENMPATGDGAYRDRTGDLRLAKPTLSQLS